MHNRKINCTKFVAVKVDSFLHLLVAILSPAIQFTVRRLSQTVRSFLLENSGDFNCILSRWKADWFNHLPGLN